MSKSKKKPAPRKRKAKLYVIRTVVETVVMATSVADAKLHVQRHLTKHTDTTSSQTGHRDVTPWQSTAYNRRSVQRIVKSAGEGLDDIMTRTAEARAASHDEDHVPTWREVIDQRFPLVTPPAPPRPKTAKVSS